MSSQSGARQSSVQAEQGDLTAIRARTLLAATHVGRLVVPGSVPLALPFIDDGGQPLLAVPCGLALPASGVGGLARFSVMALGSHLQVLGRLLPVGAGAVDTSALLQVHRSCLTEILGSAALSLCAVVPEQVGYRSAHRAAASVPLPAYADAEPDLFVAYGEVVAAHLRDHHGGQLRRLVRPMVGGGEILALEVRGVSRTGIVVDVVTTDGGWTLPVPLTGSTREQPTVCSDLRALTRRA